MIGITFGTFDLFHAGHINMLKQAKDNCDFLIVGIKVNPAVDKPKNKPINSILERQIAVGTCKYVDMVVVYETEEDISKMLTYFNVDIRFIGDDYAPIYGVAPLITAEEQVPIKFTKAIPIHTSDIRKRK